MSTEAIIVRPALPVDKEFVIARNWWITDPHLADDALRVYLFFRSLAPWQKMTQTQARASLKIKSNDKWLRIKAQLRAGGYLLEVQDSHPVGTKNSAGQDISGSKRFRFIIQEPTGLCEVPESESLIKSNTPIDLEKLFVEKSPNEDYLLKQQVVEKPQVRTSSENRKWLEEDYFRNSEVVEKPQVNTTCENRKWSNTTSENRKSYKEIKLGMGRINYSSYPTHTQDVAREENDAGRAGADDFPFPEISRVDSAGIEEGAADPGAVQRLAESVAQAEQVDEQLSKIHPSLSLMALHDALSGRVDVAGWDLVAVTKDVLKSSKGQLRRPADYVAKSIINNPQKYAAIGLNAPFDKRLAQHALNESDAASCSHDWGDRRKPDVMRAKCVKCGSRRDRYDREWVRLCRDAELACKAGNHTWHDTGRLTVCASCHDIKPAHETPQPSKPRQEKRVFPWVEQGLSLREWARTLPGGAGA